MRHTSYAACATQPAHPAVSPARLATHPASRTSSRHGELCADAPAMRPRSRMAPTGTVPAAAMPAGADTSVFRPCPDTGYPLAGVVPSVSGRPARLATRGPLLLLVPLLLQATVLGSAAARPVPAPAGIAGAWALQGTGPAGLVAAGGRLAIIQIRQTGRALSVTLRSGAHRYAATGSYTAPTVRFTWRMPAAGLVRFTGTVQRGGSRILGLWSDGHGDDGGALLVRLPR